MWWWKVLIEQLLLVTLSRLFLRFGFRFRFRIRLFHTPVFLTFLQPWNACVSFPTLFKYVNSENHYILAYTWSLEKVPLHSEYSLTLLPQDLYSPNLACSHTHDFKVGLSLLTYYMRGNYHLYDYRPLMKIIPLSPVTINNNLRLCLYTQVDWIWWVLGVCDWKTRRWKRCPQWNYSGVLLLPWCTFLSYL